MKLQPMPVFSALQQPGRRCFFTTSDDEMFFTQDGRFEELERCKRVWFGYAPPTAEVLAPALKKTVTDGPKLREAVGPQMLPFPDLWLEGHWPSGSGGINGAEAYAIYCHSDDARNADTLEPLDFHSTTYQIFGLMRDGSIRRMPVAAITTFDDDGIVRGFTARALHPKGNFTLEIDSLGFEYMAWVTSMVFPAMWAVGLMNCKNVHLAEGCTAEKKSRKQRRQRPGVRYHTIVLPGGHGEGGGTSTGDGGADWRAQHQVRGHFKTYTADAPLMGKHVGTYWWGWQVRGKKENGVVVSDYKVGVS